MKNQGWKKEKERHSLASKGISTKQINSIYKAKGVEKQYKIGGVFVEINMEYNEMYIGDDITFTPNDDININEIKTPQQLIDNIDGSEYDIKTIDLGHDDLKLYIQSDDSEEPAYNFLLYNDDEFLFVGAEAVGGRGEVITFSTDSHNKINAQADVFADFESGILTYEYKNKQYNVRW